MLDKGLVIVLTFHNQGGTASKFSSLSRDEGFFVVFPAIT